MPSTVTILVATLSFGVLALGLLLWVARGSRKRWAQAPVTATVEDQEGRHESACYHYALARNAGAPADLCEPRIVQLWREHGPFDFAANGSTLEAEYCQHHSCGRGFHELVVGDIRRLVASPIKERHP